MTTVNECNAVLKRADKNVCVKDSNPDKQGGANSARIALPVRAG